MEDKERNKLLLALAYMYSQYCGGSYGHDFMTAGETAIEILEEHGLADEETGVNEKALDELEKKVYG